MEFIKCLTMCLLVLLITSCNKHEKYINSDHRFHEAIYIDSILITAGLHNITVNKLSADSSPELWSASNEEMEMYINSYSNKYLSYFIGRQAEGGSYLLSLNSFDNIDSLKNGLIYALSTGYVFEEGEGGIEYKSTNGEAEFILEDAWYVTEDNESSKVYFAQNYCADSCRLIAYNYKTDRSYSIGNFGKAVGKGRLVTEFPGRGVLEDVFVFYIGLVSKRGKSSLFAVDKKNNSFLWQKNTGIFIEDYLINDNLCYYFDLHKIIALKTDTGEEIWRVNTDFFYPRLGGFIEIDEYILLVCRDDDKLCVLNKLSGKTEREILVKRKKNVGSLVSIVKMDDEKYLLSTETGYYKLTKKQLLEEKKLILK